MFHTIFGALLMGLGALGIGRWVFDLWRSHRSLRWPQVKGKILASELIEDPNVDLHSITHYSLDIAYEYEVGGVRYKSERVSFEGRIMSSTKLRVERVEAGYPTKAEVLVYFDPDNPAFSVLEPGVELRSAWYGLFLLIVGNFFAAADF